LFNEPKKSKFTLKYSGASKSKDEEMTIYLIMAWNIAPESQNPYTSIMTLYVIYRKPELVS
jgi:hypothetical protein